MTKAKAAGSATRQHNHRPHLPMKLREQQARMVKDAGITVPRYVVPYYRVSTDDKGQDPLRQAKLCEPWGQREEIALLAPVLDVGTSASKMGALERPLFIEACQRAAAAGAEAILIETPDRFSRQDPFYAIWELVEIQRHYKLQVYFACIPLAMQQTVMGKLMVVMQLGVGHEWVLGHTQKVVSGMRKKQAEGVKFGRKPKEFSLEEWACIDEWRTPGAQQVGWDTVALRINEMRGVNFRTDRKKAASKAVSKSSVRRAWVRRENEMERNRITDEFEANFETVEDDAADLVGVDSDGGA